MRLLRRRGRLAGLLALLAAPWAGADAGWSQRQPSGEAFSISVPGETTRQEYEFATPAGPRKAVFHSALGENRAFTVMYTLYGSEFLGRVNREALLEAAERKLVRDAAATLVDQREVSVQGAPAREVALLSRDSSQLTIGRLFVLGDRLYTLIGSGPRSEDATRDIRRFLGSFELHEP